MNARVQLPVLLTGKSACQACKGACCKRYPGATLPSRWGDDEPDWDIVEQALLSGQWVIDWWDSYPDPYNRYYIRPARVKHRVFDGNAMVSSSPCNFLTDEGCSLSDSERPAECLSLTPQITVTGDEDDPILECFHSNPKADGRSAISEAWLDHSEMLEFVGQMVREELDQRASA